MDAVTPWTRLLALIEMRRFAGLELAGEEIPDETTILRFKRYSEHRIR
jgi:IS5 family transposase